MTPESSSAPGIVIVSRRALAILVAVALLSVLLVGSSWARDFPTQAQRGAVTAFNHPVITIGKKAIRLVPATRIRNEQNLIIMPSAMPPKAEVMYRLDFSGNLQDLWILTPEEVKALGPAPKK